MMVQSPSLYQQAVTAPYELSINGGTNWQSSGSFTGLTPITYNVEIRDAAYPSCIITLNETLSITQPDVLSASISESDVLCNGGNTGTATATQTGGTSPYTYLWSNGQTIANPTDLSAGTYTVTVTDATVVKLQQV